MSSQMVLKAKDRNGRIITKGSKIKLVGKAEEALSVYFASAMHDELNNGKIYTIFKIYEVSKKYNEYSVALEESDWNWDIRHIQRIGTDVKIKPPKPVMFEPSLLDI